MCCILLFYAKFLLDKNAFNADNQASSKNCFFIYLQTCSNNYKLLLFTPRLFPHPLTVTFCKIISDSSGKLRETVLSKATCYPAGVKNFNRGYHYKLESKLKKPYFHTPEGKFEKRIVGRVRSVFAKAKHADTFIADNQASSKNCFFNLLTYL